LKATSVMPLYEYECDACGARFELIRKFSDPPVTTCSVCGADGVRKLLSSPAVRFKGSGWYVTDYAKKTGTSAAPAKADTAAAEKPAETKTDAAPASSTDKPSAAATAPAAKNK
jgi:putative FmdB family regulatory protein